MTDKPGLAAIGRLFSLLVLFLLGCRHGGHPTGAKDDGKKEADVHVRVVPAEMRIIAEKVAGLGRCEALPERFAVLAAAVEGRVLHLLKQPGDLVQAGAAIVELDSTLASKNLKEKEAARDFEKVSLEATIAQAQLTVEKARNAVEHLRPLRQRGEIAETALYDAESTLRQAELQLQTARAQYDVLMHRPRPTSDGKARSDVAQAAVDTALSQVELLTIRTPIAGVLNSLSCQLGQTLPVGTAVGEVVDSRQVMVVVWLSVADAQRVAAGQPALVSACGTTALSAPASCQIPGTVKVIGKVVDPQTGNLPVRILVENSDGKLTLGQAVSANITIHQLRTLAVPGEALHDPGEGLAVTVVRDGKTVILRVPQPGRKDDRWFEISGTDLKPGEPVVVEGGYNLPAGTEVTAENFSAAGMGVEADEKAGGGQAAADDKVGWQAPGAATRGEAAESQK